MASKNKGGLTKADLVDVVYDRHGALTKDEAAGIVDAILGIVKTSLGSGRAVRIKNFGVFEVAERAGRMGVNPASGEKMYIPPHKGLSFRPAARLKRQVSKPKTEAASGGKAGPRGRGSAGAAADMARRAVERRGAGREPKK
jgi:nucleoid DNA-binding protein